MGAGQPRPRPRPGAPHLLGQGRGVGRRGGGGAVLLAGAGGRGHALPRRHRARDEGRDPRPDAGPRPRLEAERGAGEVSGARGLGEVPRPSSRPAPDNTDTGDLDRENIITLQIQTSTAQRRILCIHKNLPFV